MFQLKKILFPVDFSAQCRGAAAYVEAMVGRFDAELVLLHVVEAAYNSALDDMKGAKPRDFEDLFDKSLKHLHVTTKVDYGEAAQKIVQCAAANRADLIMIPTKGTGIYRRLILGSTSAKVLHDADCPVWTGVHLENAPPLEMIACRRILCAVDLKPWSAKVLEWASHLAEEYQAELTLAHAVDRESARAEATRGLERLAESASGKVTLRVEVAEKSKMVTQLTTEGKSDLAVIGRKPDSGVLGRLDMEAYSIIRQSPCPVVSV
ncbi:MAG TPA: universal stress protein [Bryobacteraceae bacterium]|nr:universal stress protein [Bryobacteraceae bacterium]